MDIRIDSDSTGLKHWDYCNNYTTHIYGQCSKEEIEDCVKKTIAAHNKIQGEAQKAQKGD